jgi:hypothetical protein
VVTDEQVAALRASLVGDLDEYERLCAASDPVDFQAGFSALVTTAFVEAAGRRFGKDRMVADVVRFVALTRARKLEDPDLLDPRGAESLIRAALGDSMAIADLDDEAKARGQVILLHTLIDEARLDGAGRDEFLDRARERAERLVG